MKYDTSKGALNAFSQHTLNIITRIAKAYGSEHHNEPSHDAAANGYLRGYLEGYYDGRKDGEKTGETQVTILSN